MKLKVGQTWKLVSGEIVTIVSLPDARGWLHCLSHDVGFVRTYGLFGFDQPGTRLLEVKGGGHDSALRAILKEIVVEVLAERKAARRRAKRK